MTYLLDTCLISELIAKQLIDSLIAAIALQHSFYLVTRNENDFTGTGVAIINP